MLWRVNCALQRDHPRSSELQICAGHTRHEYGTGQPKRPHPHPHPHLHPRCLHHSRSEASTWVHILLLLAPEGITACASEICRAVLHASCQSVDERQAFEGVQFWQRCRRTCLMRLWQEAGGRSAEEGPSRGHPFSTVCAVCSAIPVSIDWVCSQTRIACNIGHLHDAAAQSACDRP